MHKHLAISLALALSTAALGACYTTEKGVVENVINGTYTTTVSANADEAIAAAREVSRDMHYTEVMYNVTKTAGHLQVTTSTETIIEFDSESTGDRLSDITVRVGIGDRALSRELLEKIKAKL